jgi:hypothetical protein
MPSSPLSRMTIRLRPTKLPQSSAPPSRVLQSTREWRSRPMFPASASVLFSPIDISSSITSKTNNLSYATSDTLPVSVPNVSHESNNSTTASRDATANGLYKYCRGSGGCHCNRRTFARRGSNSRTDGPVCRPGDRCSTRRVSGGLGGGCPFYLQQRCANLRLRRSPLVLDRACAADALALPSPRALRISVLALARPFLIRQLAPWISRKSLTGIYQLSAKVLVKLQELGVMSAIHERRG